MMRAAVGHYDGRRWRTVPIAHALPRDPRRPGEPPAENVSFGGITATKDRVWITGEFDADRVDDRFVLIRDGRGWRSETTSKVADSWGYATPPMPDAQGGVSFLGQKHGRRYWEPALIHRSAAGVWTQRPIRVGRHELELMDIAAIPGTGSFWAVGGLSGRLRSAGVVLRS